jgi:hypothetical protein
MFNAYLLSGLIPTLFWTVKVDLLLPKPSTFQNKKQNKKRDTVFYSQFKPISQFLLHLVLEGGRGIGYKCEKFG